MIKANQGHSIPGIIAFDMTPQEPPNILYHGTTRERWQSGININGLKAMSRHHVHLSSDDDTAWEVGKRHKGEYPILLRVESGKMYSAGNKFYVSDNGVWLVDKVDLQYIIMEQW